MGNNYVICIIDLGGMNALTALHITQLCISAQCQSQVLIKEVGDGKSLCLYKLS